MSRFRNTLKEKCHYYIFATPESGYQCYDTFPCSPCRFPFCKRRIVELLKLKIDGER